MSDQAGSLENNFVTVGYAPEKLQLELTWFGEIDAEKMQAGYGQALEIIRVKKVKRALIDMTRRRFTDQDNLTVINSIFGQLLQLIREPLFVALLLPPPVYFMVPDDFHHDRLQTADNHYIIIEHFLNLPEAKAWLAAVS